MINPYGKTVKQPYRENAHEVWHDERIDFTWYVLKKYHADDSKDNARWFCLVDSPYTPDGELGDVYASEVTSTATKIR